MFGSHVRNLSENAAYFKLASKTCDEMGINAIRSAILCVILWHKLIFIVELAPWMGDFMKGWLGL